MKATGKQDRQETGGKGYTFMGEREMDNMLPGHMTARQNSKGSDGKATLR